MSRLLIVLTLVVLTVGAATVAHAQLTQVFDDVFNQFLIDDLTLSPSQHANHFIPAARLATGSLTPALSSLISGNIASFPLTSTLAGVTLDLSSGRPVSVRESLGPIFAETAETLGQGNINVGVNYTYLSLNKLRGLDVDRIRFTFTHEEFGGSPDVLGDDPERSESDTIDMLLNMDVTANIMAVYATIGVFDNLDFGVALPIVSVSLKGDAVATMNSFTFANSSSASHFFGGTAGNPDLVSEASYDESATGIGDISLRAKYAQKVGENTYLGAIVDVRLPTGDEEDFMGTGEANAKVAGIASAKIGDFTPHINLGYDARGGAKDSDELEFVLGFDQKVFSGVTFAADVIGEFDVQTDQGIELFPGTATIVDQGFAGTSTRVVDLSNVPEDDTDNRVDISVGFRVAPSEKLIFIANALVPVNEGGLRSTVAPTVGLSVNF